ncbi:MAG: Na+/H+ antiporter NhaA [Bacteroidaceae bacterium]|nr:Na+/H+ antiporter NhaA [Bacteroidaceae bacterium]
MTHNYSFKSMVKKYVNSSAVLIICTVLALILANSSLKGEFFSFWNREVSLSIGEFNLFSHNGHPMALVDVINDFLMAIFFLSVGLEIKREILVGELSSRKKAMLPIIGACGGMLIPVLFFWITCPNNPEMMRGVAIPMATDIAFSLGVLSIFNTRVPIGLKIFLAALAVADDLGGIIVIALFYSSTICVDYLLLAGACVALLIIGNNRRIMSKNFYLVTGLVLWYFMLNSGIHATIAGVIVAFCVPGSLRKGATRYIERIKENISCFDEVHTMGKHHTAILTNDEIHKLKSIESAADKLISPLQELEDSLHNIIGYFIIPLFALANVGIDFSGMAVGDLFAGVALSVMAGLVVGKFVGVFTFSWVAIKLGFVQLPQGANWKSFASVCMLCGIGLTVSIFIAGLSYAGATDGGAQMLNQAKLGILCGSTISAIIGCVLLNRFLPKNAVTEK